MVQQSVSTRVWSLTLDGFDHRSVLEYLWDITLLMYGNFMWKLPNLREKYMCAHIMEFDVSRNGYRLTKTQIWAKTCNVHEDVPRMEHNLACICKLDPAVEPQCLYVEIVPESTTYRPNCSTFSSTSRKQATTTLIQGIYTCISPFQALPSVQD
jgi:hypothetical protein